MAENIEEYRKHMTNGHNAALRQTWKVAAEHYTRAIQAVPEDADAHISLGLALLNDEQYDRALRVYKKAIQLAPNDPEPLERSADALERMGQLKESAQQYVKVAEVYLGLKDLNKAISIWEHATELTPGLISVHARLAQAYDRIGDKKKAVDEYLVLAYNFRRLNEIERAIQSVERALKINHKHALSLNILQALKRGGDVILPKDLTERVKQKAPVVAPPNVGGIWDFGIEEGDPSVLSSEDDAMGPLGDAMEKALNVLADEVFGMGLDNRAMSAMQAMEHQRQDDKDAAIKAYLEAEKAGFRHAALKMNLGGLLLLNENPQEAVKHLGETLTSPNFMSGGYHALGLAYHLMGEEMRSMRYLVQGLQNLSYELEKDPEQLDDTQKLYNGLLSIIDGLTKETLRQINDAFLEVMMGTSWKSTVLEKNSHLTETMRRDGIGGVIDILTTGGEGGDLPKTVSTIDRYIRQGLFTLAMDEAHRAVEKSPYYLPVHIRMAEILMKEGRIRQAINKYNVIARDYMVRDENERAASILKNVLKMAPLDLEVRMNLIELLESEQKWEESLVQYIDFANTYQQLGDFEKSNQTLASAERLARRIEAPVGKIVEIKHAIADISQMRLNTRQAQKVFEEILEIAPEDEKSLKNLIDIYYSQNNQVEAVKRLDLLLGIYAKKGTVNKITGILEDLVRMYPQDMALRSRLASIFRKLGDVRKAIEQLDALGELQLDAGLHKDAANTIKQIIGLKPDRVDEYKKLLSQLE